MRHVPIRGQLGLATAGLLLSGTLLLSSWPLAASPELRDRPGQDAVSRIVSLVPAVTEMLFAMGAGPAVVGVSTFDDYPPEVRTRPRVGALVDPDFERILTLRPDLVIVYGSQDELMSRLDRTGIAPYVYRHAGLADIPATMRDLGARIGRTAAANAAATRLEDDLAAVGRAVAGRPAPRTALIFGRETGTLRSIYASGGVGFLHDMLQLAGGTNAFGDVARENLQVSVEVLLARAPDVIIELRPSDRGSPARIIAARDVWRALPSLPAVRTGRVHVVTDERLSVPGPRVGEAVRILAETLHGPLGPA